MLLAAIAAASPGQGATAQPGTFGSVPCSEIRVEFEGQVFSVDSFPDLKAARCGYLTVP